MRQRQSRNKDAGHLERIRELPCLGCGHPSVDAAHIRYGDRTFGKRPSGMGEKPGDWATIPLCRSCHSEQHSGSERKFWAMHGIDPIRVAAALYLAIDQETREQIIMANRNG